MSSEKAVFGILSAAGGVTALVGTRIIPLVTKGDVVTSPSIFYEKQGENREQAMGRSVGIVEAEMLVEINAKEYSVAKDVETQVIAALQRYRGAIAGVTVLDCFVEAGSDSFDAESEFYQQNVDVRIWWRE